MHSTKRYLNGQLQWLSIPNTLSETTICNQIYTRSETTSTPVTINLRESCRWSGKLHKLSWFIKHIKMKLLDMFHLILNTKSYLKNRTKNTCHEFTWKSSAIGPSPFVVTGHAAFPLTRKAALLFLSYFITMYLVWRIRNSMPSWHPGERRLHCLSWCARSSPLRTERSGSVCESEVCRPSLTEERVLSGWKKEKTNENSKRSNAKWQKKRLSRGLRKCIRIREGPLYTCFTNIFSWFSCFERLP